MRSLEIQQCLTVQWYRLISKHACTCLYLFAQQWQTMPGHFCMSVSTHDYIRLIL